MSARAEVKAAVLALLGEGKAEGTWSLGSIALHVRCRATLEQVREALAALTAEGALWQGVSSSGAPCTVWALPRPERRIEVTAMYGTPGWPQEGGPDVRSDTTRGLVWVYPPWGPLKRLHQLRRLLRGTG